MGDLGHQVARLLAEVQALQAGAGAGAGSPPPRFGGGDANDVTTAMLLEFKDIQAGRGEGEGEEGAGRGGVGRGGAAWPGEGACCTPAGWGMGVGGCVVRARGCRGGGHGRRGGARAALGLPCCTGLRGLQRLH